MDWKRLARETIMAVRSILLLGDSELYRPSRPLRRDELDDAKAVAQDLFDTMAAFQAEHGWGRAIAAPQIGVHLRIVCMNAGTPRTFLNPELFGHSEERSVFWEDCMSFPELLVQLANPRACRMRYRDLDWCAREARLEDDYAELLQHEVDHLDGVLAPQRALDERSIALRRAMPPKTLELKGVFELVG